jgi:hypothetical protein
MAMSSNSQRRRVICCCPRCHPGKEVSLRTRQVHNRANNASQIRENVRRPSPVLESRVGDDSCMNGEAFDDGSYMLIEPLDNFPDEEGMDGFPDEEGVDDFLDEEGMDGFTGFGLVMSKLNFRR